MIIIEKYMTEDLNLTGSELVVYADIASNLDEKGEFCKTQRSIAKDVGLSIKTVQRAIYGLKEKKLISLTCAKDGFKTFNIISIKNKINEIVIDKDFKTVLDYWQKCICAEDLNKANYEAYKYLIKQPDYSLDSFKEAVRWYNATISTSGYYKTYVYRFARFIYIYKRYLPGNYEQVAFMNWLQTNHEYLAQGYKPWDPDNEAAIPMEEFNPEEI